LRVGHAASNCGALGFGLFPLFFFTDFVSCRGKGVWCSSWGKCLGGFPLFPAQVPLAAEFLSGSRALLPFFFLSDGGFVIYQFAFYGLSFPLTTECFYPFSCPFCCGRASGSGHLTIFWIGFYFLVLSPLIGRGSSYFASLSPGRAFLPGVFAILLIVSD